MLRHQAIEVRSLPAFSDHRIQDVRATLPDDRQGTNEHVLSLPLLQRAGRQNHPPTRPSPFLTCGRIDGRRDESGGIDTGVHHDDRVWPEAPFVEEHLPREGAVGNDALRPSKDASRETPKLQARTRERQFLTVSVAGEGNTPPTLDSQRQKSFGQAFSAVNDVRPDARHEGVEPGECPCVSPAASRIPGAPVRKSQRQPSDGQAGAAVEILGAVHLGGGDVHVGVGQSTVQLPQPSPAAALLGREHLGEQQNLH
jgi:hypothetical protein